MSKSARFRAGTGALILNKNNEVLAFERTGQTDAWQLPQGGIDLGERSIDGVYREVFEETGITKDEIELIAEHPEWLVYEFPEHVKLGHYLGQAQKWYIFRLLSPPDSIDLAKAEHNEFQAWRWMSMHDLAEQIIYFKKNVYTKLEVFYNEVIAK